MNLSQYFAAKYPRAEAHYNPSWGPSFCLDGRSYFAVGAKVRTPEIYSGVTAGTVDAAFYADKARPGAVTYIVKVKLPKGHCDAYDDNGKPQRTKRVIVRDDELTKLNCC